MPCGPGGSARQLPGGGGYGLSVTAVACGNKDMLTAYLERADSSTRQRNQTDLARRR